MDISDIWGAHLRAIIDDIAPGTGRGVKTPAYHEVAAKTRFKKEYVYQAYTGRARVGQDFAAALGRAFANGRPEGWINVAPQNFEGASGEPVQLDHSSKEEGLGLYEFLSYLRSLDPKSPLTAQEIKEEAEAYQRFAAERTARRVMKLRFNVTGAVPDALVEKAFEEAQRRERQAAPPPEQQLIANPLSAKPAAPRPAAKKGRKP
jgi:hypothetical protein